MDAFEEIEQELLYDGITVSRDRLPKCIGYYTSLYDFIYLNVDRDLRGSKALSVLMHEMGHHRTGLTGCSGKNEYRADKWAAQSGILPARLMEALMHGCRNYYELSRELGMDESYLKRCLLILSCIYGGYYEADELVLQFHPLSVHSRVTGEVWPDVRC